MTHLPADAASSAGGLCRVTVVDDPLLDDFRFMRERDLREREGASPGAGRDGIFIGEGLLVVERMARVPGVLRTVLVAEDRLHEAEATGIVAAAQRVCVAPRQVVSEVTGFHFHRGVIASGYRAPIESQTPKSVIAKARVVLICDDISNMDNAGALFRDAAAFGVDAVLLSHGSHDPLYRKCLRTSMGHALSVPFARVADGGLPALIREMVADDWRVLGTTLDAKATEVDEWERKVLSGTPRIDGRVAVVVGHEFRGVSPAVLSACSDRVRIRMADGVDSLNVSVAAAVMLHAVRRMRGS